MPQIIRNSVDLKASLILYCQSKGYDTSERGLKEVLMEELDEVYRESVCSHRWWNSIFRVVKLPFEYSDNGYLLIGFDDAETTGDRSPEEVGWSFDWNSLHEVEPRIITRTTYVKRSAGV